MSSNDLQTMIEAAQKHIGVNDVLKLHQDYLDSVNRARMVMRTEHNKGILITSSSTQ